MFLLFKKTSKINQMGRSMVEMLGVLAVIGVLSVGAVTGYRNALDKYKANETINELVERAILLGQQVQIHGDLRPDATDNLTTFGYPVVAFNIPEYPNLFELEVTEVPIGVCEQILNAGWTLPAQIDVNDIPFNGKNTRICDNDDGRLATMVFEFDKDLQRGVLGSGRCETDSDCDSCEICEDSVCTTLCSGNERCAQETASGEMVCCPRDKRAGPYCCTSTINGQCCDGAGHCCDWWKPLVDKNGKCYACDYSDGRVDVNGVEDNCKVCSNRELWEKDKNNTLCAFRCAAEELRDSYGRCFACDEPNAVTVETEICSEVCPNRLLTGYAHWKCVLPCDGIYSWSGDCYTCDSTSIINQQVMRNQDCETCAGRTLYGNDCVLDCGANQFRGNDGVCYDCTHVDPVKTAVDYCLTVCPERFKKDDNSCGYKSTCTDTQFMGADGKCYDCTTTDTVSVASDSDCATKCADRTVYQDADMNSVCALDCPESGHIRYQGVCYDCDTARPLRVAHLAYCAGACPNRVLGGELSAYCMLPCGEDSFGSAYYGCYPCTHAENIYVADSAYAPCSGCADTRDVFGKYCVPKCPEETPLRGSDNQCYACDTQIRVPVAGITDSCKTCYQERSLEGDYCVLLK